MPQRFDWNFDEFRRIRKSPDMVALLRQQGEQLVERLNTELHAAQARRHQPVEDGYVYHITKRGTRARLFIVAATARAQAHEAEHQSILKMLRTG